MKRLEFVIRAFLPRTQRPQIGVAPSGTRPQQSSESDFDVLRDGKRVVASMTRSQPLNLLSIARLESARSRRRHRPDLFRFEQAFLTGETALVPGSFGKVD
jgi:hypothetical protein